MGILISIDREKVATSSPNSIAGERRFGCLPSLANLRPIYFRILRENTGLFVGVVQLGLHVIGNGFAVASPFFSGIGKISLQIKVFKASMASVSLLLMEGVASGVFWPAAGPMSLFSCVDRSFMVISMWCLDTRSVLIGVELAVSLLVSLVIARAPLAIRVLFLTSQMSLIPLGLYSMGLVYLPFRS